MRKGEIATLLTLGLVAVGAAVTLISSLFINNKNSNLAMNSRARMQPTILAVDKEEVGQILSIAE